MVKLELDDSRRLTGKGLLWDHPGAIMDVFVEGIEKHQVVSCWEKHVRFLLDGLGWQAEQTTYRIFEDGISLAISAPFDALYAATEVNEQAWQLTVTELTGTELTGTELTADPLTLEQSVIETLQQTVADEVNPQLLALIAAAKAHNVPWLTDDDELSLGFGASAQVWPVDNLPSVADLNWQDFQWIPVAMITGTNGKSTSVRLTSGIFAEAGLCCGVTSTDFIRVGDDIVDRGDYSGPGGARMLLRDQRVEVALLEVARGGILRRGLPVPEVDAALITNIAEDHLGQYGINTLQGLTSTKFVVAKAVRETGTLVLNADDPEVVRYGSGLQQRKCWFSLDEWNPILVKHRSAGGTNCFARNGELIYQTYENQALLEEVITAIDKVPMTFGGAASHNVHNALGAIGLGKSLGATAEHIAAALSKFRSDPHDNPGRGNMYQINGAQVIMDFAHNEHSMQAMVDTTKKMQANHKWILLSAAGDRSDHDISSMTEAALAMAPDHMVAVELVDYLRGRELGDIPSLMEQVVDQHNAQASAQPIQFHLSQTPLQGVKFIIEQLQPGDLALLLVLSDREQVTTYLNSYQ